MTIRLQIRNKNVPYQKPLDDILRNYSSTHNTWKIRYISAKRGVNVAIFNHVLVRELRSDRHSKKTTGGQFDEVICSHVM